jgi:hypothetical protein
MTNTEFHLSRIYAEGWRAASDLSVDECDGLDARAVSQLNPYAAEPARSRWSEGFVKAIGR